MIEMSKLTREWRQLFATNSPYFKFYVIGENVISIQQIIKLNVYVIEVHRIFTLNKSASNFAAS